MWASVLIKVHRSGVCGIGSGHVKDNMHHMCKERQKNHKAHTHGDIFNIQVCLYSTRRV